MIQFLDIPKLAYSSETPLSVLLIEDSETDAELIKALLGRLDHPKFQLDHATTLETGLKRLKQGGIDLVVLDLTLPDCRGYETFQRVHRQSPGTTIVVVSGLNDERLAHRILQNGAQDFLVKGNMDLTQVVRSIRFAIERKRAEQALRSSETRVRSVLDNVLDTIITLDDQGTILSVNPAGEKAFGYNSEELLGRSICLLMPETFGRGGHCRLNTYLTHGIGQVLGKLVETKGRKKDGEVIPLEISVNRIQQEGRYVFIGIARDITDRKQAEQKLVQAQNDLVQAGKLAVLGEMSAEISHELNQPLEAIQAYIDNIEFLLEQKRYSEVVSNFHAISDLTRRAGKIIKNIRNLSRTDCLQSRPVSLEDTLGAALSLMSVGNRLDAVTIVQEKTSRRITVLAEALKLEQVLINIISNALDAMETTRDKRLELTLTEDSGQAVLKIRDSGAGLAPSILPHVFEPFFTTKSHQKGLGLGLSISYNTIRELGGSLEAGNHPEGGAEFTLRLPLLN